MSADANLRSFSVDVSESRFYFESILKIINMDVYVQYDFMAVGQGLFASGHLLNSDAWECFTWVYDCGTSSERRFVEREISNFRRVIEGHSFRNIVDLFCLSHFDEDHVNGAEELLKMQKVDTLVMPYMSLTERMEVALNTPSASDKFVGFLADPAGFMFAAAGENLRRIIFITGGSTDLNSEEFNSDWDGPDDHDTGNSPLLHLPRSKPTDYPDDEDIRGLLTDSNSESVGEVFVLNHDLPFEVWGAWEFYFYNENSPKADLPSLRDKISRVLPTYKLADGSFNSSGLLRELKPIYAEYFGVSGPAKNRISLVMYTGPVKKFLPSLRWFLGKMIPSNWPTIQRAFDRMASFSEIGNASWPFADNISTLYFGDFPLTSLLRMKSIQNHFSTSRWRTLQIIQVPHHGSARSWLKGVSAYFPNQISIVSSKQGSKHFPGDMVSEDLKTHGLTCVNETQRAVFSGAIKFGDS